MKTNAMTFAAAAASLFCICFSLTAASLERTDLWPSPEKIPDRDPRQTEMPYLKWHRLPGSADASAAPRACVIVVCSRAYDSSFDEKTAGQYISRLLARGVVCVSLVHRVPGPKDKPFYFSALQDARRAARIVRSQASERGYSPAKIGILGFAAGGHLAALAATSQNTPVYEALDALDEVSPRFNFAIPIAPSYCLTDGLSGRNSRNGDSPDVALDGAFRFNTRPCSMCIFHGGSDEYSPFASTKIYRNLRTLKVPSELHLYSGEDREFFSVTSGEGTDRWFDRVTEYLVQMGFLGELEPKTGIFDTFASDSARKSYEKEDLWPEGKIPDFQAHQCLPYIEWHIPSNLATRAVQIIFSGGSYEDNSPESSEVTPARRYLNEKGMAVVTMRYRTPRPKPPLMKHITAWQDLQRAIRIVRSQAASRGLDPSRIGVMGSSAGGHLALLGAASSRSRSYLDVDGTDKIPCNVQWAVSIYPGYALARGVRTDIKSNEIIAAEPLERPAEEFVFDPDTCPVVFIHGDKDTTVTATYSVGIWEHLRRMGIQSDLHTFAHANHSFERKTSPGTGAHGYLDRIWDFLLKKGFLDDLGRMTPRE